MQIQQCNVYYLSGGIVQWFVRQRQSF